MIHALFMINISAVYRALKGIGFAHSLSIKV